jgi:PIN domain nuclease of toxin-antitoxin system
MIYLLDTHILVWATGTPERLTPRVREIIETRQLKASVVSLWELVLKKTRKGTPIHDAAAWWERYITRASVEVLAIRSQHVLTLDRLPELHRDPFDRMLVAQAQYEQLAIVSADEAIRRYAVETVWK